VVTTSPARPTPPTVASRWPVWESWTCRPASGAPRRSACSGSATAWARLRSSRRRDRRSRAASSCAVPPCSMGTTPPPVSMPPILDLRPSSMSIVGHLDCQKNGAFVCFARVLSRSSNQSNLHWVAFTNVPGSIAFSPASGVLAPGQSVLVTITVPLNACTPGLFFFQGPINTHTITWAC